MNHFSVSGGSETVGQIIVDELSDEQLSRVVEDIRGSVKRLHLETKMFERKGSSINDVTQISKSIFFDTPFLPSSRF